MRVILVLLDFGASGTGERGGPDWGGKEGGSFGDRAAVSG